MIVRIIAYGQETWYHNVVRVTSDGGAIRFYLSEHPHLVHYWPNHASVLICVDGDAVITALREEGYCDLSEYPRFVYYWFNCAGALVATSSDTVAEALRKEGYHEMDKARRI